MKDQITHSKQLKFDAVQAALDVNEAEINALKRKLAKVLNNQSKKDLKEFIEKKLEQAYNELQELKINNEEYFI